MGKRLLRLLGICVAWRFWDRRRRLLDQSKAAESDQRELALIEISLAHAVDIMKIELEVADVLDLKSVGLTTADVAALTILVAFHNSVRFWWLPVLLMGVSAVFFFLVLRARVWRYGADFPEFLELHKGRRRVDVLRAVLQEILEATDENAPHLKYKARQFRRGYRALALALVSLSFAAIATLMR